MVDVILLSAGTGTRTKLNYPKQLMRVGGRPLIIHCIELFISLEQIGKIIIPVVPGEIDAFISLVNKYYNMDKIKIIDGGNTRQESVRIGLQHISGDRVIIHESVRPFITKHHVLDLMSVDKPMVVPFIPIVPTIYNSDGHYEDRSKLVNIQLPQVFDSDILKLAHEMAINKIYTDDSSLVFGELGVNPTLIEGQETNIKITTPIDVCIAEVLYEEISNYSRWE